MIWLIGNRGMLGSEIAGVFEKNGIPFIGTDREIDITDLNALESFAQTQKEIQPISWIINCAAYTAVDMAEDDAVLCRKLNDEGPSNIAYLADKTGARLIHFSTDYVFNGKNDHPYKEDDPTDPIGVYGLTKRDGEINILKNNNASYIIRTAWLYGVHGNNFVYTMLKLMRTKNSISVVNDQIGTPTWAHDLAEIVFMLIKRTDETDPVPYGIYHFTNDGIISWYDFALEIYRQGRTTGLLTDDCIINPCSSEAFPSKVRRPAYSVLDKEKIKKHWALILRHGIPASESF
ncbi:dTDP-4-dehydrorhamnose reductase [Brucepastera parasyntrophica]|uniref:dTDP-4-dehydrorhamnose reductase n=1 Tax=Brucepastera parasyntrophica TaxID=2880008 RepID=UPI00210DE59A|nr:dTDP-4-dehydrorhamnose reductase [Brucepastera parasyntrophica]ULQ59871.1 dTDP-4-dehydrorhamnose reductase [Brucepastera parasyntrophica]